MNSLDDELVRELQSRSGDVGGHPIGMDSVRRTARRIVWRRRIAVGAVAAAVLAVAVPAGMALTGGVDQGVGPIGRPTPTVTHAGPAPVSPTPTAPGPATPTTAPTPTSTGKALPAGAVPLTTVGVEQGAPPAIPYLSGRTLHWSGTTTQLPGLYTAITPFHGGWLAYDPDGSKLVQLDNTGQPAGAPRQSQPNFAVDESGLVAWFESADLAKPGRLVRAFGNGMSDGEATVPVPPGDTPHVVGFLPGGRLVYETLRGPHPQVFITDFTPGTSPTPVPGALRAGGASEALNRISVLTKSTDFGSCWAVVDPQGRADWQTCKNTLGKFSPSGKYIAAYPAYFDGLGPSGITILDAATDKRVADFQRPSDSDLYVADVAWEDDSHLLAIVHENGDWRILRLGTDGHVQAASPAEPSVPSSSGPLQAFFFSATP